MSFQFWFLVVLYPLALGAVAFALRKTLRGQLLGISIGALLHAVLIVLVEVIPGGGFSQNANTWQGYAIIELGPFLLILGAIYTLRRLPILRTVAMPIVVAGAVPLVYWAGLVFAISVAITAGLATH